MSSMIRAILSSQNFDRPDKDICLDLLRAANGVRWRPHMVALGLPLELDQRPDIDWDPNTYLPVRTNPAEDIRYMNGGGLMYRRMWLHEINNSCCLQIIAPHFPFKTSDVLDQINEQLKTQLTLRDLKEVEVRAKGDSFLVADPYSLNWIGKLKYRVRDQYSHLLEETDILGFFIYYPTGTETGPVIPYKGLSADRLTTIIAETNAIELEYDTDLTYGTPETLTMHPDYNTSVRVFPTDSQEHPEQTIRYNRLDLGVLELLEPFDRIVVPNMPFTIHEILPQINEVLGLDLQPAEVLNTQYNELLTHYRLEIASGSSSLAWAKSHYDFEVDFGFDLGRMRVTADGSPRLASETDVRVV